MKKNILIIGAGAVGTVYAHYLAKDNHVSFFVREKYEEKVKQGFHLQVFENNAVKNIANNQKASASDDATSIANDKTLQDHTANSIIKVTNYDVFSHETIDKDKAWDFVIITLSTTALPKLDLSHINLSQATIISLSPGAHDLTVLKDTLAKQDKKPIAIVTGVITLISYVQSINEPMPITRVFFPPLTPMPFANTEPFTASTTYQQADEPAKAVAELFKSSGMRANTVPCSTKASTYPNILITMLVLALEAVDWSFDKLATSKTIRTLFINAVKQANTASRQHYQLVLPVQNYLISHTLVKILLKLAPKVLPFDIEEYLKLHFTKVKAQTYVHTKSYIDIAKTENLPHDGMQQLLAQVTDTKA